MSFSASPLPMLLCGVFLFCGALRAQSGGYHREYRTASCFIDMGGLKGNVSVFPGNVALDESADIVWIMDEGSGAVRVSLPITHVGGAQQLSATQVVVSGTTFDGQVVGHILRIELDTTNATVHIREHGQYPGFDFVDLAWDSASGVLGVVDTIANTILFGMLAGAPATPTDPVLPSALGVAVNSQDCPALVEDAPVLRPNPDGPGFRFGGGRRSPLYSAVLVSGVWNITPPSDIPNNNWHADASRGHAHGLRVASLAGSLATDNSFEVLDVLHGVSVASGVVTGTRVWCEFPAVPNFYDFPGFEHVVVGNLSNPSRVFQPLLRYGLPTPSLPGSPIILGNADAHAQTVFVGSERAIFSVPTTVTSIPDGVYASAPSEFHGFLLIGLGVRFPGAPTDPIVGTGENARLDFTLALELTHKQFTRKQAACAALPIPDLAFLTDCVLLTQWAFQDPAAPNELFYSDICGARFRSASSATMLVAGGAGPAPSLGSSPAGPSSAAAAGASWTPLMLALKKKQFRDALKKDPRFLGDGPKLQALRVNAGGG